MISVTNLEFRYGDDFRLRVDELSVGRGATVAMIGPSGCGKTTLLHLIAGIRTPDAGSVVTNDVELTGLADAGRRDFRVANVGLVFQEFELLEYLNVLDNILLPYRINACLEVNDSVRDRAVTIAKRVGLGDKLRRFATRLSQGEKQRVAVCRALLAKPALVLADEPTGNLDPGEQGQSARHSPRVRAGRRSNSRDRDARSGPPGSF